MTNPLHCRYGQQVPQSNAINVLVDSKYRKIVQYVNYSGSGGDYK